jgi:hypothetical protein
MLPEPRGISQIMAKPIDHVAREERLAAKLRENLHRRKAQARALDSRALDSRALDPGAIDAAHRSLDDRPSDAENDSDALSKQSPES